jgi:hypothetical protein
MLVVSTVRLKFENVPWTLWDFLMVTIDAKSHESQGWDRCVVLSVVRGHLLGCGRSEMRKKEHPK